MTTFMYEIMCVTNRRLCEENDFENFLTRIEAIAKCAPSGIILREKDLPEREYEVLAKEVMKICGKYNVPCILHYFTNVAEKSGARALHVPLHILREMTDEEKKQYKILGASCHSVEEAVEAGRLGCSYIAAGHIFATDCKKGAAPRGISFLSEVCKSVDIPVYAIGGINHENIKTVVAAGAKGGCVMSGLMKCRNVSRYMELLSGKE